MLPAWRLATNSLLARRNRTLLLVSAVALSAALIAAVSCAMASLNVAIEARLNETVGRSDIRIASMGKGETIAASNLDKARQWQEAEFAVGSLEASSTWRFVRPRWVHQADGNDPPTGPYVREVVSVVGTAIAHGIDPELDPKIRSTPLLEGRLPSAPGEIAIDRPLAERLSKVVEPNGQRSPGLIEKNDASKYPGRDFGPTDATTTEDVTKLNEQYRLKIGDEVEYIRLFRKSEKLKVVGIVVEPPFAPRWRVFTTLETLQKISGNENRLTQVDIVLNKGVDAEQVAVLRGPQFPKGIIVQPTTRVTSGIEQNVASQDLGFVVATVMSFLAAAFIITTGMSTGVTERQRELSVMRCIGATRGQLAWSQLIAGGLVGAAGAIVGVPLGIGFAALLIELGKEQIPRGLDISPIGLLVAALGAVVSGIAGAAFAAFKAARVSPLEGLGVRAKPAKPSTIIAVACLGLGAILLDLVIIFGSGNGQFAFWGYATIGLPAMFIGYFLISVPVLIIVNKVAEPLVRRVLRLPPRLLGRQISATPYRYGFTAGAMMSGLALMVAIWTQGHAILNDWLGKFEFPDAFAVGLNLTEESRAKLDALPFVTGTVPITLHNVESHGFGVKALQTYKTTFIAFDPEPFFRLTRLTWVAPKDAAGQAHAKQRMGEGGAILVAREFQVAQGLGVGDTFTIRGADGKEHPMEIVGVVTSPGLEIVSKFFSIGDDFTEQAIHAVFGSRKDLKEKLGSNAISMFQIGLSPDIDDAAAIARIREELLDSGLLDAGSGRRIKNEIGKVIRGTILITSSIAIFAMVISSFGVANIIIAGIQARQFEFGVLRAVGASRGLLTRLVLGEAVLIAIAAGFLGTALGIQAVVSGQVLDRLLFGLELSVKPPPVPIAVGWIAVFVVTIGAATPAVVNLSRRKTRELLAAR